MSIHIAMRLFALQDPNIKAALDDIYLNQAPQTEKFPRVVTQLVSSDHIDNMSGPSGLVDALFQWSIMGPDTREIFDIGELIRKRFDGFRGRLVFGGIAPVVVTKMHIENQLDDFEAPPDGSEQGIHIRRQDYGVWYREPIPA